LIKRTSDFLIDFPRPAFNIHEVTSSFIIFTQLYLTSDTSLNHNKSTSLLTKGVDNKTKGVEKDKDYDP